MFGWITSRRLSLFIVMVYGSLFLVADAPPSAAEVTVTLLTIVGYFLIPLVCIWYGDELGEYVGTLPGPAINRTTPGWMVKLGGWFLLFLPALIVLIVFLNS